MTTDSGANRRSHLRYRDPDSKVLNLFTIDEADGSKRPFIGLIVNESFTGMACVYVGEKELNKAEELFWEETDQIHTKLQVIRCYELTEDVYYLALKIA